MCITTLVSAAKATRTYESFHSFVGNEAGRNPILDSLDKYEQQQ